MADSFPVDPATLETVRYVMNPDNFDDERSHLLDWLAMEDIPGLDVAADRDDELTTGWHPDQIIAALINEIERLRG